MRIALVHSFYASTQPSGENRVVEDQAEALLGAGNEVLLLGRHTDQEQIRPGYAVRAAARVATGHGSDPSKRLNEFAPDIVHIHNLFPNFGTAWVRSWGGPIVVSVHNFRSVCSNGLLFRDGSNCMECPEHGSLRAVVHRCYRGSVLATVPVAMSRSRDGVGLLRRADAVITTSDGFDVTLRSVIPGLATVVIPNFGADQRAEHLPVSERRDWIALGRLSPEKGFLELVRSWPNEHRLVLIGDGPEADEIISVARGRNVEVLPSVSRDDLRSRLPCFTGLVFPSLWREAAPQVVVEAMRVGLPVVAHEQNGIAQLVASTGAGATYRDPRTLKSALFEVAQNNGAMSARASEVYEERWTSSVWLRAISNLYESLIGRS